MALPNIDISDLVYLGWGALSWVMKWALVLFLLVFALTFGAGVMDLAATHFSNWKAKKGEGKKGRRVRE